MQTPRTTDRTDRSLLVEVVLILGLLVLALFLYWRPAADGVLAPRWWHWLALGTLFFAIAWLHTWRRRRLGHKALHRVIREESAQLVMNSTPASESPERSKSDQVGTESDPSFDPDAPERPPAGERPSEPPI